jgi:hypothetical protein
VRARRRGHLRLDLVNRQIGEANDRIDHLTERLADGEEWPRDSSMSSAT